MPYHIIYGFMRPISPGNRATKLNIINSIAGYSAVEAATGGAGAGAPAAAEWDDRGEHDIILFGCSPPHLSVPLIPRHAGGGDASLRRSPERERRFGLSCRGACGC